MWFNWKKNKRFVAKHVSYGPLVSVVVPIYDRTELLRIAIESVLNQDYENYELILVCDGSPKETVRVVKSYLQFPKVKAVWLKGNSGNAVRARNTGILNASGKYIAFLDSDDVCTKQRLGLSVAVLEQEGVDVVYGSWIAIVDGTRVIEGITDGQLFESTEVTFEKLWNISVPCQSTVTVRKSLLEKSGLLKPEMHYREDHELWLRLAYFGAKFRNVREPFTFLRLHSGNNEIHFEESSLYWLDKLRKIYEFPGPRLDEVEIGRPLVRSEQQRNSNSLSKKSRQ